MYYVLHVLVMLFFYRWCKSKVTSPSFLSALEVLNWFRVGHPLVEETKCYNNSFSFSIVVVKETGSCLKALLCSQNGLNLLKKLQEVEIMTDLSILEPFKQKRKVHWLNIVNSCTMYLCSRDRTHLATSKKKKEKVINPSA